MIFDKWKKEYWKGVIIAIGVCMLMVSFILLSLKFTTSFTEKDHTLIAIKILLLLFMIGIGIYLTGKGVELALEIMKIERGQTKKQDNGENENLQKNGQEEMIRSIYEQNWEHMRHIETERYWFLNVYALVLGAIISGILVSDKGWGEFLPYVLLFLFFFSLIWSFMTLKLNIEYSRIRKQNKALLEYYDRKGELLKYMHLPIGAEIKGKTILHHLFSVGNLAWIFYALVASISLGFFSYTYANNHVKNVLEVVLSPYFYVPFSITLFLLILVHEWLWKKWRKTKWGN